MNTKKQIKALVSLATLMSTAAISGAAYAAETTNYTGSECQAARSTKADVLQRSEESIVAANPLSPNTPVHIVCPINRRNITNTTGTGLKVTVKADRRGAQNTFIHCTLLSISANGTVIDLRSARVLLGSGGVVTIPLLGDGMRVEANGAYTLECETRQGGRILKYEVIEP